MSSFLQTQKRIWGFRPKSWSATVPQISRQSMGTGSQVHVLYRHGHRCDFFHFRKVGPQVPFFMPIAMIWEAFSGLFSELIIGSFYEFSRFLTSFPVQIRSENSASFCKPSPEKTTNRQGSVNLWVGGPIGIFQHFQNDCGHQQDHFP